MKRTMFGILVFACLAAGAFAQTAPPPLPKAPVAVANQGGKACDVYGIIDSTVVVAGVEYDAGYLYSFAPSLPMADVTDNHKKWLRVLSKASEEQDKGGPYEAEVSEFWNCDGTGAVRQMDGSLLLKGITLAGLTRIQDVMLKIGAEINDRTRPRAGNKNSFDHDHTKGKRVKRDEFQRKVRDDDEGKKK